MPLTANVGFGTIFTNKPDFKILVYVLASVPAVVQVDSGVIKRGKQIHMYRKSENKKLCIMYKGDSKKADKLIGY